MRVGMVGLGTMGGRMARRLVRAGHVVSAYDPVVTDIAGVVAKDSAGAVAAASEVVLSSVPMPGDVESAYLGPEGVRAGAAAGLVCADLSTIDPATAQRVADGLAAVGVAFLDAPVSGGPGGVEAGTLSILVGGEAAALQKVRPALEAFAAAIVHLGPVGAGSTVKLANQLLVGVTTVAVMEAMTLGARAGIEPRAMFEALTASAGDSVMLRRNVGDFLLPRQFTPAFALRLLLKDLRLCVDEAERLGVNLHSARLARDLYAEAAAAGLADEDYAAIVKLIETGGVGAAEEAARE